MSRIRIRSIEARDNAALASVIRTVMPEFGAKGPGFAINDPEVDHMYEAYSRPGAAYYVLETDDRQLLGGAGLAPLEGGEQAICELRKMYFLTEARGGGFGKTVLALCVDRARALGYRRMYIETLSGMDAAMYLYERFGFEKLSGPLGNTGHFGCDRYYARDL
jgi:putative acetyltransferase